MTNDEQKQAGARGEICESSKKGSPEVFFLNQQSLVFMEDACFQLEINVHSTILLVVLPDLRQFA
jgi:hypothetical protein